MARKQASCYTFTPVSCFRSKVEVGTCYPTLLARTGRALVRVGRYSIGGYLQLDAGFPLLQGSAMYGCIFNALVSSNLIFDIRIFDIPAFIICIFSISIFNIPSFSIHLFSIQMFNIRIFSIHMFNINMFNIFNMKHLSFEHFSSLIHLSNNHQLKRHYTNNYLFSI